MTLNSAAIPLPNLEFGAAFPLLAGSSKRPPSASSTKTFAV
jgi:hypothetical protein